MVKLQAKDDNLYVDLKNTCPDPLIIQKVPARIANFYKIIPLDFKDQILTVATAVSLSIEALSDIRLFLGLEVKEVLAPEAQIKEAMRKYYGLGAETLEGMVSERPLTRNLGLETGNVQDIGVLSEDASVVKFVNQVLSEAVKERATDIHFEPFYGELRIRFRIDGLLFEVKIPETIRYFRSSIVSRIKIMAQLNIAEHRLPQDGRIKIRINNEELDLRVSVMPTAFGEAVHLRILSSYSFLDLEKLGLDQEGLGIIEKVIQKPHGVIFVTGPTGSGKSTTLYACLSRINSSTMKIVTIEDPIEYQLRGVNQVQVAPKIGLSFSNGLRHMLRHDPDVMMIGEVMDSETAEIAIRASLTGHLVFSTLHTNDAAGAVSRLLDMGIEPFLASSSLECLIAQRLVRKICPECKAEVKNKDQVISQIKDDLNRQNDFAAMELCEGKGCEKCRFSGYQGRTGIYEILSIDREIRELILKRSSSQKIRQKAISKGMRTLRRDGLKKVLMGITTYSEVLRITPQEEHLE